jgi:hypothetical protein
MGVGVHEEAHAREMPGCKILIKWDYFKLTLAIASFTTDWPRQA